jgi:thiol-disulfide isomerase/thioredoxin
MMGRRFFLLLLTGVVIQGLFAQKNAGELPLAPFEITLANNQSFKSFQLKKNVPVMLMYFSPECDHCRDLTKDILKNAKALVNKQLVMITYFPVPEVKRFESEFELTNYPNIKVGTEGTKFIVRKHYNIRNFPFIVLYDKQGKLIKTFREQTPSAQIVNAMKSL